MSRDASTIVVLNATGIEKAVPLSWIGRSEARLGMLTQPFDSKLCLKPKRSRMTRTEYRTAAQAGMSNTFGTS
eukprot:scaffold17218_cov99-Phaeocystis_antarctica.AAC.6